MSTEDLVVVIPEDKNLVGDGVGDAEQRRTIENDAEYTEVEGSELPGLEDNNEDTPEREVDPRLLIGQKHDEKRAANSDKLNDDAETHVIEDQQDIDDSVTPSLDIEEGKIPIVVYGRTIMADKDKVDKAGGVQEYQKQVAVTEGFKQNKEQKEFNDRRAAELDAQERELQNKRNTLQSEPYHPPATGDESSKDVDLPLEGDQKSEKMLELSDLADEALLDGDKEARRKYLAELFELQRDSQDTPQYLDQLEQRVANKAIEELDSRDRGRKINRAKSDFMSEHPDMDAQSDRFDPNFFKMVDNETNIVEANHPEFEPSEVLSEAYRRMSAWRSGDTPRSEAPLSKKLERKQSRQNVRQGTGRNTGEPETVHETKSEYVQNQRRLRGLE